MQVNVFSARQCLTRQVTVNPMKNTFQKPGQRHLCRFKRFETSWLERHQWYQCALYAVIEYFTVATSEGWLLRHLKAGTLASCQLPSLVPSLPSSLKYLLRWMTRRIHSLCFSMNLPELKNHPVGLTFWFQWHREKLQRKTSHDSVWQIGDSRPSRKSSWETLWTFCAV